MKLYTIGYSGYDQNEFIRTLKKNEITRLIDVRSVPASRFRPEYNQAVLERLLPAADIEYIHMGRSFGARQENAKCLPEDGVLDFSAFSRTEVFLEGVRETEGWMKAGIQCALMCAEKDPVTCHRSILIGRSFHERGWKVVHIREDGLEDQNQLEQRLLDMYFPERNQMSLLEEARDEAELLKEAYRAQNLKIGFRKEA